MDRTPTCSPPATRAQLAELLRVRATYLSYTAFAVCVQRVLAAQGYEEIRMLSKSATGGRKPLGGADMDALAPQPLGRVATLIQVKRHARSVPRRCVDELRGTLVRYDVPHGVAVTTSVFSLRARESAIRHKGRTIRLVDGAELGRLMLEARLGVLEEIDIETGMTRLRFNEEAFRNLEAFSKRLRQSVPPYPLMPHP